MDASFLLNGVMTVIPLVLSLTVHEFAHAWSAWKLGDDTAMRQGRLTLNPLAHIDPIGSVLLPLLGIPFGWAKPVPVNPAAFRRDVNMSRGMMLTAAAGPLSNLVLALLCAITFGLALRWAPGFLQANAGVVALLKLLMGMNLGLALFNMLPVPPLDGSRVLEGLLPTRLQASYQRLHALAPFLLLGIFFFGGRIISGPFMYLGQLMMRLVAGLSGAMS